MVRPRFVFLAVVLGALYKQTTGPIEDVDFWWHLRTGQWIWDHKALPAHDLYTYTISGHAWVVHEWGSELLMLGLWRLGGAALVSLFFGLVIWLGVLFVYLRSEPRRQPLLVLAVGMVVGTIAGATLWSARPQAWDFLFSALELYLLQRFLDGDRRAVYGIPPILLVWANLHAGYAIGLVFVGVAGGCELVAFAAGRDRARLRSFWTLLATGAVSALAVMINPYGPQLYRYSLNTTTTPGIQQFINEWQSPDFHNPVFWPFGLMLALLLPALALRRPTLFEMALVVLGLVLALDAARLIAIFVATATPVLIRGYGEGWRALDLERLTSRLRVPERTPILAAVGALALVAVFVNIALALSSQPQVDRHNQPVAAADWLASHPGFGSRLFNGYGYGGYLAYRFYPQANRRVFIFGDTYLDGTALVRDYARIEFTQPGWQQTLASYDIDYVVDSRGSALVSALEQDPNWSVAYQDSDFVVLGRGPSPSS